MEALPAVFCPTDLTDREWALLDPSLPPAKPHGRPHSVDLRGIVNGLFSMLRSCLQVAIIATHVRPRAERVRLLPCVAQVIWERIHTVLCRSVSHSPIQA